MIKKWIGVALLAGWLGLDVGAGAQQLPTGAGPAALPEPIPCSPGNSNFVPGALSPLMAPKGPPDELALPGYIPNAFPCEPPHPGYQFFYLHVGTQGLQRQGLGHKITAFLDAGDNSRLDTGNLTPLRSVVPVQDLNNLTLDMAFGIKGTIGYLLEDIGYAVELTGTYIPEKENVLETRNSGLLNSFFFNAPIGFEGNNGLFRQADRILATQQTTFGNVELNVRSFSKIFTGIEPIVGIRYISLQDRFSITSDDDSLTFVDAFGLGDPTRLGSVTSRVQNNIIAPQLGAEYQFNVLTGLALGFNAKVGLGVDFADIENSIERGDGRVGPRGTRQRRNFTQIYEVGAMVDLYMLERFRVRGGYTALWIVNVPEAVDQIDFDLSRPLGREDNTGSIFFHGPSVELQFLF